MKTRAVPNFLHAGHLVILRYQMAFKKLKGVFKVKAHVKVPLAKIVARDPMVQHSVGNGVADEYANMGRQCHPSPSEEEDKSVNLALESLRKFVDYAPQALLSFGRKPTCRILGKTPKEIKLQGAVDVPFEFRHKFVSVESGWQCLACLVLTSSKKILQQHYTRACKGSSLPLLELLGNPKGHSLAWSTTFDGVYLVFCLGCGSFATKKLVKLAEVCMKVPTPAGCQALKLLRLRQHPITRKPLSSCVWRVGESGAVPLVW